MSVFPASDINHDGTKVSRAVAEHPKFLASDHKLRLAAFTIMPVVRDLGEELLSGLGGEAILAEGFFAAVIIE